MKNPERKKMLRRKRMEGLGMKMEVLRRKRMEASRGKRKNPRRKATPSR